MGVTSTTTLTVGLEAPAMEGHSGCDPKRRGRCGSTPSVVLVDENLYKPLYVCTKCVVVLAPRSRNRRQTQHNNGRGVCFSIQSRTAFAGLFIRKP